MATPPDHHEEARDRVEGWLASVEAVSPDDYQPIAVEQLPEQARADSLFWCDAVFEPEAHPYDASPEASHALHRSRAGSPDLLCHRYRALGLTLRVVESRSFFVVTVVSPRVDRRPPGARAAWLRQVGASLFRHGAGEKAPARVLGTCLSPSDPEADPLFLSAWNERLEWGVRHGEPTFVCYKRVAQRLGFLNDCQWFDPPAPR